MSELSFGACLGPQPSGHWAGAPGSFLVCLCGRKKGSSTIQCRRCTSCKKFTVHWATSDQPESSLRDTSLIFVRLLINCLSPMFSPLLFHSSMCSPLQGYFCGTSVYRWVCVQRKLFGLTVLVFAWSVSTKTWHEAELHLIYNFHPTWCHIISHSYCLFHPVHQAWKTPLLLLKKNEPKNIVIV